MKIIDFSFKSDSVPDEVIIEFGQCLSEMSSLKKVSLSIEMYQEGTQTRKESLDQVLKKTPLLKDAEINYSRDNVVISWMKKWFIYKRKYSIKKKWIKKFIEKEIVFDKNSHFKAWNIIIYLQISL